MGSGYVVQSFVGWDYLATMPSVLHGGLVALVVSRHDRVIAMSKGRMRMGNLDRKFGTQPKGGENRRTFYPILQTIIFAGMML